ncbi:uncharacterized protein FIBRA_02834 [Fibroporia radiculosa]|uniref:DUF6593 domain-containing protein n=1 Tax=Fibroporia radiculosa TaxID=599839 RepID=J4HVK3_9APHY|nr:uncharacterized protein FIBRA_02834 [Fibroporia radiculosa]CCM00792.1 predicted protein [Fibroporia radiculosa]
MPLVLSFMRNEPLHSTVISLDKDNRTALRYHVVTTRSRDKRTTTITTTATELGVVAEIEWTPSFTSGIVIMAGQRTPIDQFIPHGSLFGTTYVYIIGDERRNLSGNDHVSFDRIRSFRFRNGEEYRWKHSGGSCLLLFDSKDDAVVARSLPARVGPGEERDLTLEIRDRGLRLTDRIFLTFVIVEHLERMSRLSTAHNRGKRVSDIVGAMSMYSAVANNVSMTSSLYATTMGL